MFERTQHVTKYIDIERQLLSSATEGHGTNFLEYLGTDCLQFTGNDGSFQYSQGNVTTNNPLLLVSPVLFVLQIRVASSPVQKHIWCEGCEFSGCRIAPKSNSMDYRWKLWCSQLLELQMLVMIDEHCLSFRKSFCGKRVDRTTPRRLCIEDRTEWILCLLSNLIDIAFAN